MTFRDWLDKQTVKRSNRLKGSSGVKNELGSFIKNQLFEELNLNDGMSLSVQASSNHMCCPRETIRNNYKYEEVEVYSHGVYINELVNYASETRFTYGYVPVEIMEELVEKHGGIKEG